MLSWMTFEEHIRFLGATLSLFLDLIQTESLLGRRGASLGKSAVVKTTAMAYQLPHTLMNHDSWFQTKGK